MESDQLPNGWHMTTLAEIARQDGYGLVDGPFGSNLPASAYVPSGIPVIRGSNLSLGNTRFRDGEFVFVSDETAKRFSRSLCSINDIIFTKKGTLGQIGIIPAQSRYPIFLLSSNQMKLSVDQKIANPQFVYYYISSPASRAKIIRDSEATGVPKTNLAYLRTFPILLPPLSEQHSIAHILGTLDDKIDLNQHLNDTLEGIAQALFKSWFVDFDPVKAKAEGREPDGMDGAIADLFPSSFIESPLGLIPQGWEVKGLDEIATFLNGLALQKYPTLDPENYLPVIKISQLRSGNTEGADKASMDVPPDYIITDGDILFSWSGSLEVEIWCGGRGALNQHLFKVSSKDFPKWFYFLWTRQHLDNFQKIAEGKATTMGHIQRKHLSEAKVICPPVRVIQGVNEIMETLLEKSVQLKLENRNIANLRDLLLPRLISGELPVGAISETVEAVAS